VMAGTNLKVRGLYIPRPLTPGRSHLILPQRTLSPQHPHESFIISDEPPQDFLTVGGFFRQNSSLKNFTHFLAGSNLRSPP
jgi:hypothetical protein